MLSRGRNILAPYWCLCWEGGELHIVCCVLLIFLQSFEVQELEVWCASWGKVRTEGEPVLLKRCSEAGWRVLWLAFVKVTSSTFWPVGICTVQLLRPFKSLWPLTVISSLSFLILQLCIRVVSPVIFGRNIWFLPYPLFSSMLWNWFFPCCRFWSRYFNKVTQFNSSLCLTCLLGRSAGHYVKIVYSIWNAMYRWALLSAEFCSWNPHGFCGCWNLWI